MLKKIAVAGYKSIEHLELDLNRVNVLVGANGAGKSNLLSFFDLLSELAQGRLQLFVGTAGGANYLLFCGAKATQRILATLDFQAATATLRYRCQLSYADADSLVFGDESIELGLANQVAKPIREFGKGHRETRMESAEAEGALVGAARQMLAECRAFHFHDTSSVSRMRQAVYIHDNKHLRHDGGNLAAFLYKLQKRHTPAYQRIVQTVRQIAPWFGEFVLEPLELNENNLLLRWREQDSRAVFGPHQASDGTLRGMALVALLLQPEEDLPGLIVIDEPELGLHPYALVVVAALLKQAAHRSQVVVATQSVALLDQFSVEDVIVVDRAGSRSVFQRLSQERMVEWLEDYSLGELWQKNVLGGVPA